MNENHSNYNLLEKHWIPVLWNDGHFGGVGIREALTQAGRIRQIAASNPMDNISLFRLLLAVLQWCKQTLSEKEQALLEHGMGIPAEWLNDRLGPPEKPNIYFELLGKNTGFFQDQTAWDEIKQRGNENERTGEEVIGLRPATDLLPELPSGTSIAHFRHTRDRQDGLCPSCCAIGLVRLSAFASSSKHGKEQQKPAGLNGVTPAYGPAWGQSLLMSLRLNWPLQPLKGDAPWWADPNEPKSKEHIGPLRAFTWQPRRVWLERSKDDQAKEPCSGCSELARLIYGIAFLPGWQRPFGKAPWSDDPHLLIIQIQGAKKKTKVTQVSFPGPAQPVFLHAKSWRNFYKGIFQRQLPGTIQKQPKEIVCAGPAANKALYQDASALVLRSPPNQEQPITELEWLDSIDLRDCLLKAMTRPTAKRLDVTAAMAGVSADLEQTLRERFDLFLKMLKEHDSGKRIENAVKDWRNDVEQHLQEKLKQVCDLITPGSPLRQYETRQRVEDAFHKTVQKPSPTYKKGC